MMPMFVTELTSHPEMSWLKADARENMPRMVVTELQYDTRNVAEKLIEKSVGSEIGFMLEVICSYERGAVLI